MRTSVYSAGCLLVLVALAPAPGRATAPLDGIFVCTDAEGQKIYQNSAEGPGCHRVDGIVSTIPSAELPRGQARRQAGAQRASISPASFPRVDTTTQRLRDGDRRRILEEELRAEEDHLGRLRQEFNRGHPQAAADEALGSNRYNDHVQRIFEEIERSEGNVASLRRELTPVRY